MEWFKFYAAEYLSDPKTRNLSSQFHSCWLHLLCFAANSTIPGVVEYLTEEDLMTYSGISPRHEEWEQTKGVMKQFEDRGMIEIKEGKIIIKNWRKRQESYMTAAERQKKYRDGKKQHPLRPLQRALHESDARIEENRKEKNNTGTFSNEKEGDANAKLSATAKALRDKKIIR